MTEINDYGKYVGHSGECNRGTPIDCAVSIQCMCSQYSMHVSGLIMQVSIQRMCLGWLCKPYQRRLQEAHRSSFDTLIEIRYKKELPVTMHRNLNQG